MMNEKVYQAVFNEIAPFIPEGWTKLKSLLVAPHEVNTHDNPIPTNDNENHRMSWDNVILIPK